jgi:Spy/CpxP family protein refolding chaperone
MSENPSENVPTNGKAPASAPRRRYLRRSLLALGILVGGGTGGFALAMGGPFHGPWDPGRRLERMQSVSKRALDAVGATSEQENRIHDIIASAFTAVTKDAKPNEDMRKRLVELLKAPTVDRAAVEAQRAEIVRSIDARSKIIAGALLDAAGQLDAGQRAKLADRITTAMERHRGFGGWRRPGEDGAKRPDGMPRDADPGAGPDKD